MDQRKSFNFGLAQSQICEIPKKESLKSNQLNLLNLNFSRCSSINSNTELKSDRTPRKLNYKYERMNNSFRLVQVNADDTENKQNQGERKVLPMDSTNSQMHMTINSLCQRIEKLQKSQIYDSQRQQFNLHKAVEKIIQESTSLQTSKYCLQLQKKIENMAAQVKELKEKLIKLPQSVMANEKLIVKECINMQMLIQERNQETKMQTMRNIKEQMQKIYDKISYGNKKLGCNEKCQEKQKQKQKVQSLMVCMQQNLQTSLQTFRKILQNHRQQLQQVREQQVKIGGCYSQMELKLNKVMSQAKQVKPVKFEDKIYQGSSRTQCLQNLIATLFVEFRFETLKNTQKYQSNNQFKGNLVYGIDPHGQLVDGQGFYLTTKEGNTITLTTQQIKKLIELQIYDNNK